MTPQGSTELLSQLRDIRGAPEAAFWPPAPGWWIRALALLALLIWGVRVLRRRVQARRRRLDLLERLGRLRQEHDPDREPQAWLAGVNRLLKVTARRTFPDQEPGVLTGTEWTAFLGRESDPDVFSPLAAGPYEPQPSFDSLALEAAAERWLQRHG